MQSERITGKEVLEQYKILPYELVLHMAVGLAAINERGEQVQDAANLLASKDSSLFNYVASWPKEKWEVLCSRAGHWSIPDKYNKSRSPSAFKEMFFNDLPGFIFIRNEVEEALGKPLVNKMASQTDGTPVTGAQQSSSLMGASNLPIAEIRSLYSDKLSLLVEISFKEWAPLYAYYYASVEGGAKSNRDIAKDIGEQRKMSETIEKGEAISRREGLPLLTMPLKREIQKVSRPPRV